MNKYFKYKYSSKAKKNNITINMTLIYVYYSLI